MDANLTTVLCKKNYRCEIQRRENRMKTNRIFLSKAMAPEGPFANKDDHY
jgi:hypothetical protein